jgi:hypothetical protein
MKPLLGSLVLSLSITLLGSAVWADAVPPEAAECFSLQPGASCTVYGTKEPGQCAEDTCTSTKPWLDGGTTTSYPCLQCVPAPADGSCTIGRQSVVKRIGPWALALLFPFLALLARGSRRRK